MHRQYGPSLSLDVQLYRSLQQKILSVVFMDCSLFHAHCGHIWCGHVGKRYNGPEEHLYIDVYHVY